MSEDFVLELEHIRKEYPGVVALKDVTLQLRRGEILGIAGLIGAGRTETAMAVMGVLDAKVTGSITLEGKPVNNRTPREVIDQGINIVTEDRRVLGLVPDEDIKSNVILSSLDKVSKMGVIIQNEGILMPY